MSFSPAQSDFNFTAFDQQIADWLKQKLPRDQILAKAIEQWPGLPVEFIKATIGLLLRTLIKQPPVPINAVRDLYTVHRRRARHIRKIEKRFETEDAPIALHNLYRGLLRDHEASCHKILSLSREDEMDRRHREKDELNQIQKQNAEAAKRLQESFRHSFEQEDDEEAVESSKPPARFSVGNGLKSLLLPLGCLLGLLLCMGKCLARETLTPIPALHQHNKPIILTPTVFGMPHHAKLPLHDHHVSSLRYHLQPDGWRLASISWPTAQWHRPGIRSAPNLAR